MTDVEDLPRSGIRGITWNRNLRKWRSAFRHDGAVYLVGFFENQDDALLALHAARQETLGSAGHPYEGCAAIYCGRLGMLTEVIGGKDTRNVWWAEPGGAEHMFSLRRDGVWRKFPGPANGPGLEFLGPLGGVVDE